MASNLATPFKVRYGAEYTKRIYNLLIQIFTDQGVGTYDVDGLVTDFINKLSVQQVNEFIKRYASNGIDVEEEVELESVNEVEKARGHQYISKAVNAAMLAIIAGMTYKDFQEWARKKAKANGYVLALQYVGAANAYIHKKLGFADGYEWDTFGDDRVRDEHERNQGVFYKWGEKTNTPSGGPPKTEIRCRCSMKVRPRWSKNK